MSSSVGGTLTTLKDLPAYKGMGTPLTIPLYQRAYVWDEGLVCRLVQDVHANGAHLLGTLILHDRSTEAEAPRCDVVDGQQRLTTLVLVLRELRAKLPDHDDLAEVHRQLAERGLFSYLDGGIRGAFAEFIQSKGDSAHTDPLGGPDQPLSNHTLVNLGRQAKAIRQWISQHLVTTQARRTFADRLLSVSFAVLECSDFDIAYRLFMAVNVAGVPLEPFDLLRPASTVARSPSDDDRRAARMMKTLWPELLHVCTCIAERQRVLQDGDAAEAATTTRSALTQRFLRCATEARTGQELLEWWNNGTPRDRKTRAAELWNKLIGFRVVADFRGHGNPAAGDVPGSGDPIDCGQFISPEFHQLRAYRLVDVLDSRNERSQATTVNEDGLVRLLKLCQALSATKILRDLDTCVLPPPPPPPPCRPTHMR